MQGQKDYAEAVAACRRHACWLPAYPLWVDSPHTEPVVSAGLQARHRALWEVISSARQVAAITRMVDLILVTAKERSAGLHARHRALWEVIGSAGMLQWLQMVDMI
eukprot:753234-Pelagomonas_calceolata.AAC.4